MSSEQAFSTEFIEFLSLLQSGKRRKPTKHASQLLALPLAADVRAFFQAWSEHNPPHVALGEFWFDDKDPGGHVPQLGDTELEKPPRADLLMFGTTPGGDLWAFKKNASGEFAKVVLVAHDEEWREYDEASSLEKFIEHHRSKADEAAEKEAQRERAAKRTRKAAPRADNSVQAVALKAPEQRKLDKNYAREEPTDKQKAAIPDADYYCSLHPSVKLLAANLEQESVAWVTPDGKVRVLDRSLGLVYGDASDGLLALCDRTHVYVIGIDSGKSKEVKISLKPEDTVEADTEWSYLAVTPLSKERLLVRTFARILLVDLKGKVLSAQDYDTTAGVLAVGSNGSLIAADGNDKLRVYRCEGGKLILALELVCGGETVLYAPGRDRLFAKTAMDEQDEEQWLEFKVI